MKNYIVLDLEWNQSPDGKDSSLDNFPFEIIEVGAIKLNSELEQISEFRRLIKPKVYQEIHYKISEVTHMNMRELKKEGESFGTVIDEFFKWCDKDDMVCTWGSMDLTELQRNMTFYKIEIPFKKPLLYYDIQKLYSLYFSDGKTRNSLDLAVEELGLKEGRPFHRALDDAYYTAMIMKHMDFQSMKDYVSVDYFRIPELKEEEIYLTFPNYSKYVSRSFLTKEEAMEDKTVTDLICHKCNRMLRKKIRWFSYSQKFYLALGYCPVHGYLKGKIRMKKTDGSRVYVVKTMRLVDQVTADLVYEKKEDAKIRRNEKIKQKKLNKKIK